MYLSTSSEPAGKISKFKNLLHNDWANFKLVIAYSFFLLVWYRTTTGYVDV